MGVPRRAAQLAKSTLGRHAVRCNISPLTPPRQTCLQTRRWKSSKAANRPKVASSRKRSLEKPSKTAQHDELPSYSPIAASTLPSSSSSPTYIGNLERPTPLQKSINLYQLKTARGLTTTTYLSTVFFSGTAVMTFQNYAVMAATQPFIYWIGSGLSLMWAGVAGYCFYAPLRMVSSITLLPTKSYENMAGEQQQLLRVGFHQTLPFVKYKPLVVAADDVGTDVPISPFHARLKALDVEAGGTSRVRRMYKTFIKMFARNTMVYLSITGHGIWKVDLDPATARLNEHDGRLSRAVRQRYFQPWWRKS